MRKIFNVLLGIAIAVCIPSTGLAISGLWLDVNITSIHSEEAYVWNGRERQYNDRNFGLGIGYEVNSWLEAKAGWFENSYEKTSFYAVAQGKLDLLKKSPWIIAPGCALGIANGYQNTPEQTGEITPWGLVTLTIGHEDRWRINLGYLPAKLIDSSRVDFVAVNLSLKL
jgi:hypothetical protein